MSHPSNSDEFNEDSFRQALQKAEAAGDIPTIQVLLQHHLCPNWAKPASELREGYRNALKIAANANDTAKAKSLLSDWVSGSLLPELEVQDFHWSMAAAIDFGNRDLVRLFLKHGAGPESSLHMYFLRHSSRDVENFEGILQDFLDAGWDLNDSYILRDAAAARNEVLFRWLLHNGADPNKRPDTGTSPMSCIAEKGTLASLQLLFDHGANIDNNSMSAAARRGKDDIERIAIMQLLITNGGDINALEVGIRRPSSSAFRTAYPPRYTALYEAARADDVELLEFLMRSGADPRLRIRFGEEERTAPWAVMLASKEGRLQVLGAKIKSGMSGIDAVKTE